MTGSAATENATKQMPKPNSEALRLAVDIKLRDDIARRAVASKNPHTGNQEKFWNIVSSSKLQIGRCPRLGEHPCKPALEQVLY